MKKQTEKMISGLSEKKEMEKCKNSSVYFYNKYVKPDGQKELTEKEYEDFAKQLEYERNTPSKLQSHYKDRSFTSNQSYKKLLIKK